MKTLKEEMLEYSGVLTESSKLSELRWKLEKHVKRTLDTGGKIDDKMLERFTDLAKIDIVKDDSLKGTGIPHFRLDMDIYNKFDGKKRFIFYEDGD